MSDRNGGILTALTSAISNEVGQHRRAAPIVQHDNYAFFGSFITGALGYVGVTLGPYAGQFSLNWKLGFIAVFAFGLMLLRIGWLGTRGKRRNPIGAVMSVAAPAFGYYAIVNYLPSFLHIFWFRAAAAGLIAAYAVRFWLDVRSPGRRAHDRVAEDIAAGEWKW